MRDSGLKAVVSSIIGVVTGTLVYTAGGPMWAAIGFGFLAFTIVTWSDVWGNDA